METPPIHARDGHRRLRIFRHPAISLWQSSLHRVLVGRAPERETAGEGLAASLDDSLMRAASDAAHEHVEGHVVPRQQREPPSACARLFARLAIARFNGYAEEAARLESEVRFLSCDPLWLETLVEYERALLHRRECFYRRHSGLEDFVLSTLPDEATVALLADWGTGMPDARGLLEQLATFSPDVIIHLGDIYYSGTPHEVRAHFTEVFDVVFGAARPPVFSLAGNHDRYSGGEGYRELLEVIGQPASYFCLRNRYWQFLAMDTGYHDVNPSAIAHTVTRLEDSEAIWLIDKVQHAGTGLASGRRGTILLSHHPFFSNSRVGRDDRGKSVAVNFHLHRSLAPILEAVTLWFWGHEHELLLFEPYAGLTRGRCIGAGAVPLLVHERTEGPPPDLVPGPGEKGPPSTIPGVRLGNDGEVRNHAYAILRLHGPRLSACYYEAQNRQLVSRRVPNPGPPIYEESITLPSR